MPPIAAACVFNCSSSGRWRPASCCCSPMEPEALTHSCLARAWAKRGADLRVEAPGQPARIAMTGALDFVSRQLIVETSKTKRSADAIALLERRGRIYGAKIGDVRPGVERKRVAIVPGTGPVHTSKATRDALAARRHWLRPEWLAKYPPELNDIEHEWKTLKGHHLAHQIFKNVDSLKTAIDEEIKAMNANRKHRPLAKQRISA